MTLLFIKSTNSLDECRKFECIPNNLKLKFGLQRTSNALTRCKRYKTNTKFPVINCGHYFPLQNLIWIKFREHISCLLKIFKWRARKVATRTITFEVKFKDKHSIRREKFVTHDTIHRFLDRSFLMLFTWWKNFWHILYNQFSLKPRHWPVNFLDTGRITTLTNERAFRLLQRELGEVSLLSGLWAHPSRSDKCPLTWNRPSPYITWSSAWRLLCVLSLFVGRNPSDDGVADCLPFIVYGQWYHVIPSVIYVVIVVCVVGTRVRKEWHSNGDKGRGSTRSAVERFVYCFRYETVICVRMWRNVEWS